jgi:hypothetical protein
MGYNYIIMANGYHYSTTLIHLSYTTIGVLDSTGIEELLYNALYNGESL